MFRPLQHNGKILGYEKRLPGALFFFGTRFCSESTLPDLFPAICFRKLRQVHGNDVHWSAESLPPADGHATKERNVGLVIVTADCLPVLIANDETAVALHAGWRGLESRIIRKSLAFFASGTKIAAIGPHIGAGSFEVDLDVAERLRAMDPQTILPHTSPQKKFVDLGRLACGQLRESFPATEIFTLDEDTFTSSLFHSYRREKGGGRQFSFVALV